MWEGAPGMSVSQPAGCEQGMGGASRQHVLAG